MTKDFTEEKTTSFAGPIDHIDLKKQLPPVLAERWLGASFAHLGAGEAAPVNHFMGVVTNEEIEELYKLGPPPLMRWKRLTAAVVAALMVSCAAHVAPICHPSGPYDYCFLNASGQVCESSEVACVAHAARDLALSQPPLTELRRDIAESVRDAIGEVEREAKAWRRLNSGTCE